MADLTFIVDYSSLKAANKEIEKTGSSAKKSARVFEAAFKSAELQTKKNLKAVRDQINFSKRMEAQKVKEAKASAQAAAQQSAEQERLKNKFVQGYTAASLYSKELNDLGIARKRDIISIEQQRVALDRLNKEYAEGSGRFAVYANAMGKSANRAGVAMQQTGYQVGDFLVQVQSGTNPMVAFGQQATQLVGILYLLPQATLAAKVGIMGLKVSMAAIIAVVSIAIPLATAFGAYWMRSKKSADEAASSVDKLKSAIDGLESVTFDSKSKGLGAFEEKWKSILSLQREYLTEQIKMSRADLFSEMGLSDATAALEKQLAPIERGFEELPQMREIFAESQDPGAVAYREQAAELSKLKALKTELNNLDLTNSKTMADSFRLALDRLNAAHDLTTEEKEHLRLFADKAGIIQTISQEGEDLASSQKSANTDLQGQLDKLGKRANEWSRSMSKGYKEAQDATAVFKEQQRLQEQALRLQDVALAFGADSKQYRAEENKIERENLALKLEQAGVDDSHIQSLLLGNMALEAGLKLLKAQRDVTFSMFEGSDAAERMRKYAGRGTPTGTGQPPTGSTGTSVVKESDLEKLRYQVALETELLGKTEARQRVIQAVGITVDDSFPKTVAGLEAQITANENLLRIEEERKRMNDLVTGSMENGLMAMADGTKTVSAAFRDMAREIIAELYRILVVQQMVNAAKSFFGFPFADGGAFSGGSQIQAYADGGVVGSPTLFPMAGGKTGLMGEAGPEAIMPLKRGANGKLGVQMEGGGGDNVVINQSFNFQANGDDSVKKIIAQAAPQIAQMTKNSMLNDRRRGGTTKAVFG
jgi:hypothetical protein